MSWNDTVDMRGSGGARGEGVESPGDQIGPYKLISPLGEGGFGTVWLAERREPFVQQVAVKIVKAGMDSKAVVARFEQERQALAVMNHPGIARVLDGGLTSRGRPYFAMEYVKGEPLTAFCDRVKLGIEDRLRLFEQACEAIQHAHMKGIVHRDLKPGNVLAFMVEGEGPRLKVIDFGVAKAMVQRMSDHTIFTESGLMIGTPEYMSPEQADPTAGDIDTRSDIYSLGVLLYELLVGATPFDAKELRKKAYGEIQRTLREQDPPSPSARLSTLATRDRESASRIEASRLSRTADLIRRLRGELEWIPLKAMRKEPQHRYQTAIALAEDVRNYLEGKPLLAAPESVGYRMRKYVRRNRALVAGASAVAMALLTGLGLASWQWRLADRARSEAEVERDRAQDFLAFASMGRALDALKQHDIDAMGKELQVLEELGKDQTFAVRLARALGDTSIAGIDSGCSADDARWKNDLRFTPDGGSVTVVSSFGVARRLAIVPGGRDEQRWLGFSGENDPCACDPAKVWALGGRGTYAVSGVDLAVWRLDWDTPPRLKADGTPCPVVGPVTRRDLSSFTVAISPEERTVAATCAGGVMVVGVPDLSTLTTIQIPWVAIPAVLDIGPGSERLAGGRDDGGVSVWDLAGGGKETVLRPASEGPEPTPRGVRSIRFSPNGKRLACGSVDGSVELFPFEAGSSSVLRGHQGSVYDLAFGPDGSRLATGGRDGTVRVWNVESGTQVGNPLMGSGQDVLAVDYSPDGTRLAGLDRSGTVRIWDMTLGESLGEPLRGHTGPVEGAAFSPDAAVLATVDRSGEVRLWDTLTRGPLGVPRQGDGRGVYRVQFTPDGRTMVTIGDCVLLWNMQEPQAAPERLGDLRQRSFAIRPDGSQIVCGDFDGGITFWETASRKMMGSPLKLPEPSPVLCLAFSPDGETLAIGRQDGHVQLLDVRTRTLRAPMLSPAGGEPGRTAHPGGVYGLAFSPDGSLLATAGWDGTVGLWDMPSGTPRGKQLNAHRQSVFQVAFTPDGRTLVSVGRDCTVRLWDVASGRAIGGPLGSLGSAVSGLAVSADGTQLAVGDYSRLVHLWNTVPLRDRVAAIRSRLAQVQAAATLLRDDLTKAGSDRVRLADLERKVCTDPRFAGEMRTAARIAVGQSALPRQTP